MICWIQFFLFNKNKLMQRHFVIAMVIWNIKLSKKLLSCFGKRKNAFFFQFFIITKNIWEIQNIKSFIYQTSHLNSIKQKTILTLYFNLLSSSLRGGKNYGSLNLNSLDMSLIFQFVFFSVFQKDVCKRQNFRQIIKCHIKNLVTKLFIY